MRTNIAISIGLMSISAACTTVTQQRANREERRVAYVRVVNTMPGGSALDIFSGDQKIFSAVKPGAIVQYREVPRGMTMFRTRTAGHDKETALAENIEILGEKEYSTIVLRPDKDATHVQMTVFDDHVWAPSAGKAKVRIVHVMPGMGDIDVYSKGNKLLSGVDFKDESRYVEVDPAATRDLVLKQEDNQKTVATVSNLRMEANQAYTVLLAGSGDKPRTIVLQDRAVEEPNVPAAPYPI